MNVEKIKHEIMFGDLTNEQLESVVMAVKFARAQLALKTKRKLSVGASVKFTSTRNGHTYQGTVQKIAIKYVTVKTSNSLFRVPANMLEEA
jgi:hypothetical protein